MISKVYISHSEDDESMAVELSSALSRVGLECYVAMYRLGQVIPRSERTSFGIRNSDCMIAILTVEGSTSSAVNQEIGFAKGIDMLIIPLQETGAQLPFFIEPLKSFQFSRSSYRDAVGRLIKTIRDLSRLDWLKVTCPRCSEEMTQYLTTQEEVDHALQKGSCLETVCSYCQNTISLDPRTFEPLSL